MMNQTRPAHQAAYAGPVGEALDRFPSIRTTRSIRAVAAGAGAVGALAVGAMAIGALAIGRLAIGSLALKRGRVRRLTVGELEVGRLHVRELVIDNEVPLGVTATRRE